MTRRPWAAWEEPICGARLCSRQSRASSVFGRDPGIRKADTTPGLSASKWASCVRREGGTAKAGKSNFARICHPERSEGSTMYVDPSLAYKGLNAVGILLL